MAQYAIIPANKIGQVQLSYSVSTPASWQPVISGVVYGGMEEVTFSSPQLAEIASLGGKVFLSASLFQAFVDAQSPQALITAKLRETDWTQLPDSGLSDYKKALMNEYRGSLTALLNDPTLNAFTELPVLNPSFYTT